MAKTYVLDRVATDLAHGFTHPAIQRLSSLVAEYPHDLDLRRRLAAVHRRVGNRIQAGRWDYLTIGADSRDTHAFERAFPSARVRLREVRWPYRAGQAATGYARARLAKLMAAAEAERSTTRSPSGPAAQPSGAAAQPSGAAAQPSGVLAAAGRGGAGFAAQARALVRQPLAQPALSRWWIPGRVRNISGIPLGVAAVVSAPLVAVGMVTVVQWIVQ